MKNRLDLIIGLSLTVLFILGGYKIGYAMATLDNKPTSDLFWIDNTRVHKDSIISLTDIYDDTGKIGEYIRVTYGDTFFHIECLNENGYTYQDFRNSWIVSFMVGTGEMTIEEALEEVAKNDRKKTKIKTLQQNPS